MEPNGVSKLVDVGKTSKPKSSKQNNNNKRSVNKQEMDIYKSRLDLLAQDATREQVSFPATLSSIDRKLLHTYAHKLGLDSRSVGKGKIDNSSSSFAKQEKKCVCLLDSCQKKNVRFSEFQVRIGF